LNPKDNTGSEVLEVIASADKFNHWMYETIKPFSKGNILEIGSGIGNISKFFIEQGARITLSDFDDYYIEYLNKKYSNQKINIISIDLQQENFEQQHTGKKEVFDSIIMLNVLEHIQDDSLALKNCSYLLKPGGNIIILTPSYSFLYSSIDKALGHYRRYSLAELNNILIRNHFNVKKRFRFNALGIPAWFYGKILRLKTIPSKEMNFYNKLTPIARLIDRISFRKAGLSCIIIGEKAIP
jgi:ubiquinone/menaquinone biosynthesis C-methylase UbiE